MRSLVPIPRPEAAPTLRQRSAIATLAAAGQLTADHVEAAWRFASLWYEMVEDRSPYDIMIGTAKPSSERAVAAKERLQSIRSEVGGYGLELLIRVCVEGYAINDLFVGRRPRDTHADMLRVHLAEISLILHGRS